MGGWPAPPADGLLAWGPETGGFTGTWLRARPTSPEAIEQHALRLLRCSTAGIQAVAMVKGPASDG
jgi:hypothetical protein